MNESPNGTGRFSDTVELRMRAQPENLTLARLALTGVAVGAGVPQESVADLKLAVTEACTNAIQHAYRNDGGGGEIVVRYTAGSGELVIEVEDSGLGFDPEGQVEGESQGLGLMIIRELTDELSVDSGAAGSRVAFVKRFSPEG